MAWKFLPSQIMSFKICQKTQEYSYVNKTLGKKMQFLNRSNRFMRSCDDHSVLNLWPTALTGKPVKHTCSLLRKPPCCNLCRMTCMLPNKSNHKDHREGSLYLQNFNIHLCITGTHMPAIHGREEDSHAHIPPQTFSGIYSRTWHPFYLKLVELRTHLTTEQVSNISVSQCASETSLCPENSVVFLQLVHVSFL